ncbi:MAG: flagellar biosynthetic protein FliO [Microbacteriaceae bacterium]|nr:MAG: flagellar biosynthetic protein FliO [Microbacteriaceae bacterium]
MDTLLTALRVVVSLGAVLGLIWFVRKRISKGAARGGNRAKAVNVVGRQSVGAKASVVVVEADGRRFVLGVTEHSISVLHVAQPPSVDELGFAETMAELAGEAPVADGQDMVDPPVSLVAGSVFAASTWKRAAAALRSVAK